MRIQSFQHDTTTKGLIAILQSGSLKPANMLSEKSSVDNDEGKKYVYLTPWNTTEPHSKTGILLHFEPALLESYPRFFINGGNAFGPTKGTPSGKECNVCDWTLNTMTQPTGKCVKHSLEDIDAVLEFDMEDCDGGPEVGIEGEIQVLPHLTKITMPVKDYAKIKHQIPSEYAKFFQVKGGRRRKTKRGKITRLHTRSRR